jgi:hypothetical protein
MKIHLRISPTAAAVSARGFVQTVQDPIEWVGNRSNATADYLESVLVTQQKLKNQLGIEATLEEIPSNAARVFHRFKNRLSSENRRSDWKIR